MKVKAELKVNGFHMPIKKVCFYAAKDTPHDELVKEATDKLIKDFSVILEYPGHNDD